MKDWIILLMMLCASLSYSQLSVVATPTDLSCHTNNGNADGSITITVSNGAPPYTYEWTSHGGFNSTQQNLNHLSSGTYSLTVTDSNGDIANYDYALSEPTPVSITIDIQDIDCEGGNANVTVTASGGIPPYEYSINGGGPSSSTEFSLEAGSYQLTVIDANNCIENFEFTLAQPESIDIIVYQIEDECQLSQGELEIFATGGTAPYVASWTSPTGGSLDQPMGTIDSPGGSMIFTAAQGGETYTFTITDVNGCQSRNGRTITIDGSHTGEQLSMEAVIDDSSPSNSSIDLEVSGGSPPYTYNWIGPNGTFSTNEDLSAIEAGTYSVTVTDTNACEIYAEYEIDSPLEFDYTLNEIDSDCIAGGGSLEIYCSQGLGPYTISYTGGNFDQNELIVIGNEGVAIFTGIEAGKLYSITIVSASGYVQHVEFESLVTHIPELAAPHLCLVTSEDDSSNFSLFWEDPMELDGITAYNVYREGNASGTYFLLGTVDLYEDNTFVDDSVEPNLQAYKYIIRSTDGCAVSKPSNIHKTIHLQSNLGTNGQVNLNWDLYDGVSYDQVTIMRGDTPDNLEELITLPSTLQSYTDPNPPSGNVYYQIVISSVVNCTYKTLFVLKSSITAFELTSTDEFNAFGTEVFPNPTQDKLNLRLQKSLRVTLYDLNGQLHITETMSSGVNDLDFSNLQPGIYLLEMTDEKQVFVKRIIKF